MQKTGNDWIVDLHEITIEDGFNARYDYGDIKELANSIIANGLKVPLKGIKDGDKFILTDGHRRFKALTQAHEMGHTEIKIIVSPERKMNIEERTLSMITYNSGKPFTILEEADIYSRLTAYGWQPKEIAERVGKTPQWVRDCLLLMQASTVLKNQIKKGLISGSAVVDMMKKEKDTSIIEKKVEKAINDNAGQKITSKHVTSKKPNKAAIAECISKVENKDLQNVLKIFIEFQDGTISEKRFLTGAGTIKLH